MEFNLVQNRKENFHHDHIPFNLKGNGILVFQCKQLQRRTTKSETRVGNWAEQSGIFAYNGGAQL